MEVAQNHEDYEKRGGLFKERKREKPVVSICEGDEDTEEHKQVLERLKSRVKIKESNDDAKDKKSRRRKSHKKKSNKKRESASSSSSTSEPDAEDVSSKASSSASEDSPKSSEKSKKKLASKKSKRDLASKSSKRDLDSKSSKRDLESEPPKEHKSSDKDAPAKPSTPSEPAKPNDKPAWESDTTLVKQKRKQLLQKKVTAVNIKAGKPPPSVDGEDEDVKASDTALLKYFERAVRKCEEQFIYKDIQVKSHVSERNEEAEIVLANEGAGASEPQTVISMFELAVKHCQDMPALRVQRDGEWMGWTWQEYYFDVVKAAKSLINLDLKRFQSVNILGQNSPEWAIINFATIFAGAFPVGLYPTDNDKTATDVAIRTDAVLVFVDNPYQLQKYITSVESLSKVEAFVMWEGTAETTPNSVTRYDIPVYNWEEFLALGMEIENTELEKRLDQQNPGHCCTMVVTPGMRSLGNQKVVMLSHDNVTWNGYATAKYLVEDCGWGTTQGGERTVSFLPLAHADSLLMDLYVPLALSGMMDMSHCVYFPSFSTGSIIDTLRSVRPTGFYAIPQVYEQIGSVFDALQQETKGTKKMLQSWAKKKAAKYQRKSAKRGSVKKPLLYGLADSLVYKNQKEKLGMDQVKFFLSVSAPIPGSVLNKFGSLGMHITECYGMSETAGIISMSTPQTTKLGSVGLPLDGVEVKIRNMSNGEGELLFRGRNVMMGYLDDFGRTDSALDREGWVHSGDVGSVDEDGFLFLLGKLSNQIQLQGSTDRVFPEPIERIILSKAPMVSDIAVVGHKRKHLAVLVSLKCQPDPEVEGRFTKYLAPQAQYDNCRTIQEAKKNPKFVGRIQDAIDWYNGCQLCTTENRKVKGFFIVEKCFSISGSRAELTPTLKPNRSVIMEKYKPCIKQLYLPGYDSMKQTSYFGLNQARKAGKFAPDQGRFLSSKQSSIRIPVSSSQSKNITEIHREEVYHTKRGVQKFVMNDLESDGEED